MLDRESRVLEFGHVLERLSLIHISELINSGGSWDKVPEAMSDGFGTMFPGGAFNGTVDGMISTSMRNDGRGAYGWGNSITIQAVSYTHLDVYKRQPPIWTHWEATWCSG